jgi:retron-type reverse transcriptase
VTALLNAIYEEDFLGFSYGFRPGCSAHGAMDALCVGIHSKKVSFILDADIRSFFDEISQGIFLIGESDETSSHISREVNNGLQK